MKKAIYIFIFFISQYFFGQQSNQLWKGYFSYNEIVDVESSTNAVFASTQNALFSQVVASSNLNVYNSITGLKPDVITTIHHSDAFNKTFVGNNNGLILIQNAAIRCAPACARMRWIGRGAVIARFSVESRRRPGRLWGQVFHLLIPSGALGSGLSFAHEWSPDACAFSATFVIHRGCLGIPYAGGGTRFARTVIACGRNAPHIPGYGGGAGRPPGYRVRRRGQLFFVSVVTPVGAHPAQLCREPIRR